jgi:hypothetical protein
VTPVHGHGSRSTSALARRLAAALVTLLGLALLALGPAALPAGAVVVEAEGVQAGVQPHSAASPLDGTEDPEILFKRPEPLHFENAAGNPIVSAAHIYAIYWDPTDHYHGDWQELIDAFLERMGTASGSLNSVFSVAAQYTDSENKHAAYNSTFMGASVDTEPYPGKPHPKATDPAVECEDPDPMTGRSYPNGEEMDQITCLTDAQIREQLQHYIVQHSLPTGMETVFYVLTPPGVTVCLKGGGPTGHCSDYGTTGESYANSFCSYHSDINPEKVPDGNAKTILYGVIPWSAGGYADGHLALEDERPGYECQDGGFNPASNPIEQLEEKKEKTKEEKEEDKKKTLKEQREIEKAEELEGPHEEQPNQLTTVGPDGFWDHGLADVIVNQIAEEQQNIVTDPLLDSWHDPADNEDTDECRNFFAPTLGGSVSPNERTQAGNLFNQLLGSGTYYLNDAFNLAALELPYPGIPCVTGTRLEPKFTSPNPVNVGEVVGFDGMESDIMLDVGTKYSAKDEAEPTYALYTWNFGDGSPTVSGYAPGTPPGNPPATLCEEPWLEPCASSTFHAYKYGGTYDVKLTVTDVGGDTAEIVHPVTVIGPAPPAEESGSKTGGGGSGGSGSASDQTAPSTTTSVAPAPAPSPPAPGKPVASIPGPVAAAAAVSNSLKSVARSGLVIHYSVNEQVAGRFEVLLPASTARQLKITGRAATGLPAGFPKSLVIGQALLVTTKGGHSSVRIKFPKRTAKHLRRAHSVTLTLRLIVHNAAKSPLSTTVTSTVVLHG